MIVEGLTVSDVSVADTGISPGELYVARRNTDWKLLECREVLDGCVYPKGIGYPFSLFECFKVIQ